MFPNHALKAVHLEAQNSVTGKWEKIPNSEIVVCRLREGTSGLLGGIRISRVKVVISEAPTNAEVSANGGHGHSDGQIYLSNADFLIGSSCNAGYEPEFQKFTRFKAEYTEVNCRQCEPGQYGENGLPCEKCMAGKYSQDVGLTHRGLCKNCEAGYFSKSPGSLNCTACAPGRATRTGKTNETCMACARGMYQDEAGRGLCKNCEAGYFSTSPGSVKCTACAPGRATRTGETNEACMECASGMYQDEDGRGLCKNCEAGYFSTSPGSVKCTACAPGRATRTGETNETCMACARGMYQDEAGAPSVKYAKREHRAA